MANPFILKPNIKLSYLTVIFKCVVKLSCTVMNSSKVLKVPSAFPNDIVLKVSLFDWSILMSFVWSMRV